MSRSRIIFWAIFTIIGNASGKKLKEDQSSSDNESSDERTLIISKLILAPILAGIGLKIMMLLPIVLAKISLLGLMSFVSSNLSLLMSAVTSLKSYFFDDVRADENYNYDFRHKIPYDHYNADPHELYHDHEYRHHMDPDAFGKYPRNVWSYPLIKRLKPLKLLGKIKDVIKDHFQQSDDHKYAHLFGDHRYYEDRYEQPYANYYSHHHPGSSHKETIYDFIRYLPSSEKFYDGFDDWSLKEIATRRRKSKAQIDLEHKDDGLKEPIAARFEINLLGANDVGFERGNNLIGEKPSAVRDSQKLDEKTETDLGDSKSVDEDNDRKTGK